MRTAQHRRRLNEVLTLLAAHLGLLSVGIVLQIFLATTISAGVFAASYGFVLVYAYFVATSLGYTAVAVRARQKPLGVRLRYLLLYHVGATLLMAFILLLVVVLPIAVPPEEELLQDSRLPEWAAPGGAEASHVDTTRAL